MFTVQPFEAKELGNASFVVADPETKQAVVIDPVRDVDQYLTHAEQLGFRPIRAIGTDSGWSAKIRWDSAGSTARINSKSSPSVRATSSR